MHARLDGLPTGNLATGSPIPPEKAAARNGPTRRVAKVFVKTATVRVATGRSVTERETIARGATGRAVTNRTVIGRVATGHSANVVQACLRRHADIRLRHVEQSPPSKPVDPPFGHRRQGKLS